MHKLGLALLAATACGGRSFTNASTTNSGGETTPAQDGGATAPFDASSPGADAATTAPGGAHQGAGGSASGGGGGAAGASNTAGAPGGSAAPGDAGENLLVDAGACLPPAPSWQITSNPSSPDWPPVAAIDGDASTRWTSARVTQGDEWLTVEFPRPVTLSAIVVRSVFEPGEGWAVRLGNDLEQTANPIVAQGAGDNAAEILGDVTMTFDAPAIGAFLTLQQTGSKPDSQWSVYEITPVCGQ